MTCREFRQPSCGGWRLLPVVVGLVLLTGPAGYGQPPRDPPPADDDWNTVERNEPSLSLSVNGPGSGTVYRGWPVLIRLEVWHPRFANRKAAPMILAAGDGPWSGAITLEVKDEQGTVRRWPLHSAATVEKSLTLTATTGGELVWWLMPEETAQIPEGTYRLMAALDSTQSAVKDGWKGKAVTEPLSVDLKSPPASLSEEQQAVRSFLTASYHVVRKEPRPALAIIDELLKREPNHIRGLTFRGDLLAADGKAEEAFAQYERAAEAYRKKYPKAKEPPLLLLQKQKALLDKLLREQK